MALTKAHSLYMARPEVTFSTDLSANGSGYAFIHAGEIAQTPEYGEPIVRNQQDSSIVPQKVVIGAQGGQITFKTEARGVTTANAADDGTTASHGEMGLSLRATMGDVDLDVGTTFAAGWTTTTGDVASAAGLRVGSLIYRIQGGSEPAPGKAEVRRVSNIATNTLTVTPAWTTAPSNTDVCYAMACYQAASSGHQTEDIVIKGQDSSEHLYTGCMGDWTLSPLAARAVGEFAWTYVADDVDHTSAKGSLPAETDSYPDPVVVRCAPFYIGSTETLTSEVGLSLGNDIQPKAATSGCQGRAGWVVVGQDITWTSKVYFAEGNITQYVGGTTQELLFYADDGIGNVVAISIPAAQIVQSPTYEDESGQVVQTLTWKATRHATLPPLTVAIG